MCRLQTDDNSLEFGRITLHLRGGDDRSFFFGSGNAIAVFGEGGADQLTGWDFRPNASDPVKYPIDALLVREHLPSPADSSGQFPCDRAAGTLRRVIARGVASRATWRRVDVDLIDLAVAAEVRAHPVDKALRSPVRAPPD